MLRILRYISVRTGHHMLREGGARGGVGRELRLLDNLNLMSSSSLRPRDARGS